MARVTVVMALATFDDYLFMSAHYRVPNHQNLLPHFRSAYAKKNIMSMKPKANHRILGAVEVALADTKKNHNAIMSHVHGDAQILCQSVTCCSPLSRSWVSMLLQCIRK